MHTLVKFNKNWADEFNVYGYRIVKMTVAEAKQLYKDVEKCSWYFGTNEGFEKGDVTLSDFVFWALDAQEVSAFVDNLGLEFGYVPDPEDIDEDDDWN